MANNLPSFLVTTTYWSIFCEEITNEFMHTSSLIRLSQPNGLLSFLVAQNPLFQAFQAEQGKEGVFFMVMYTILRRHERICSMWYQEAGFGILRSKWGYELYIN